MLDLATYELIDRYLKGMLSESEKILFENQQLENHEFAEEVRLQALIHNLVLEKGLVDIREKVGRDLHNKKNISWLKTIILSAVALGVGTCSLLYFSSKESVQLLMPEKTERQNNKQPAVFSQTETEKVENVAKKSLSPIISTRPNSMLNEVNMPVATAIQEEIVIEKGRETPKEQRRAEIIVPASQLEPCKDIIFEVRSEPSCAQKQNGKIELLISSIQGGSRPYSYSIAGDDFGLESMNNTLGEGNYLVQVKDSKNCVSEKHVQVTEKKCTEYEDYWFNPAVESWKFPLKEYENGSITIVNKSGRVVFSSKINHGMPDSWDGKAFDGSMEESGTYLYIIESNETKIKQGYITIIF